MCNAVGTGKDLRQKITRILLIFILSDSSKKKITNESLYVSLCLPHSMQYCSKIPMLRLNELASVLRIAQTYST